MIRQRVSLVCWWFSNGQDLLCSPNKIGMLNDPNLIYFHCLRGCQGVIYMYVSEWSTCMLGGYLHYVSERFTCMSASALHVCQGVIYVYVSEWFARMSAAMNLNSEVSYSIQRNFNICLMICFVEARFRTLDKRWSSLGSGSAAARQRMTHAQRTNYYNNHGPKQPVILSNSSMKPGARLYSGHVLWRLINYMYSMNSLYMYKW